MAQKKAGTIKKTTAHIKNASSVSSGSKQTESLRKQSEKSLSMKGKNPKKKPAGNREKQRMEKLPEKCTKGLRRVNESLLKAKSERRLAEKIVELNLAKDALAEQAEQLESFFMHTITPLVFLDPGFNFIRVNEAYAKSCNRDASEFPGHNHFDFYPHEENEAIFKRVVETKLPYQAVAKPFVFPDYPEWGVTYWDWVLFPVLDSKDEVAFLVFSLQEVTERALAEQAIYESEKKYRSLIEQASDGIVIFDRQLNFIDANPMASQISGFSREELLRLNARDLVPEDEKKSLPALVDKVFAGGTVRQEMRILDRNANHVPVEISANLLEDGNIQTIVRDITDRKETEKRNHFIAQLLELFAKKTSRKEYLDSVIRLIQEWTGCRHLGIRLVNEERYIPYVSYRGFSEEFMKLESMISLDSDTCVCIRIINGKYEPQDASALTPSGSFYLVNAKKYIEQLQKPELARFRGNCIGNSYVSLAIIPVRYQNQPLGAIHLADEREGIVSLPVVQFIESMAARLIGEAIYRFSAEEEIMDSREQLRNLYLHLQSVREEERTHIAREIHDEFGTILTALKMDLSWLEKQMPKENTAPAEKIRKDLDLINSAIKTVQRISSELRPGILDHLGLAAAMEWQVKEFCNRAGMSWEITIDLGDTKPARDLSTTMFRILQESLTNIARHAEATEVSVSLKEKDNVLALEIIDNGEGITEEQLSDRSSFGLIGMRERAQHFGGNVLIQKADGKGTKVLVTIPL